MIIENQKQVTDAVLEELKRAPNPRFREIMSGLVRHLHDFARDVKLTEEEFQQACAYVNAIGQHTNARHNEAVLMAGSLGLSSLICLLNNGNKGQTETAANMLGPFWRLNSPRVENGGSIVFSPVPGPALFVKARVIDECEAADRRRGSRRVAVIDRGLLRQSGSEARRHESARQTHNRQGRPLLVPLDPASRLPDPDRWPGRRTARGPGPTQYAPRTPAFPDLQDRASRR